MDDTYNHVIPNMNAEEYRNLSDADRPPVHDKQLQVIKVFQGEYRSFRLSHSSTGFLCGIFKVKKQLKNLNLSF